MPNMDAQPPITGAYYQVLKPIDDLKVGDRILMWVEEGQIHGQAGERGLYYDETEFREHFAPLPEGRKLQLERINGLLAEASNEETAASAVPQLPFETGGASSSALITTQHRSSIIEAKQSALLAKKRVEVIKAEMQGLLKEQQKALELAARKWEVELGKLNYAISSINLYLGRDESIVCIQEGQAASIEEPLCIRQTILFMDEETALHTEEGGLDFKSLGDFDNWICQPQNLQRVLPERKGIIALRLRRSDKFYANASIWEQIMFQEANGGTYILVRNGERLWRIWNDIELPDHLFPTQAEFEGLFYDRWNRDQERLRPGTPQYQKAMAQAQGLQKRYFQIVLLMQGLLDRTQIFKPLPVERVNLLDPAPDAAIVRLIRDAENILGTGSPGYREWLKGLNAKLDVGKRIVFGGTEYMSYQYESHKDNYSRTRPKFTSWPDHLKIYTLKGVSTEHDFYFSFPREGVRARATFHCGRHDSFILNFDDVTEEDIQFYLNDRCNRHEYLSSFPTLQAALTLKAAERETERPFVDLLAREAAQKNGIPEEQVRPLLATVIPWWKQKTQVSRNLTADEKAAYSQILKEVMLRLAIRDNPAGAETAKRIQEARPDWLVIAKDARHTVVCLRQVPEIKGLVTREEWNVTGEHCVSIREWYMPDSEQGRWEVLAAGPEWGDWPKHGRRGDFISEPEYQQLLQEALAKVEELRKQKDVVQLVAITAGVRHFYLHGIFTRSNWSGPIGVECACKALSWERTRADVHLEKRQYSWRTLSADLADEGNASPNAPEKNDTQWDHVRERLKDLTPALAVLPFTVYGHRLLFLDEKALQESRKIIRKQAHRRHQQDQRHYQARHFRDVIEKEMNRRFWEHEKSKYIADGGLLDLWEDHAKTIKRKHFDFDQTDLDACLHFLVEKAGYKNMVGKTLAEIWSLAGGLGWKAEHPEANNTLPGNIILTEMKEEK